MIRGQGKSFEYGQPACRRRPARQIEPGEPAIAGNLEDGGQRSQNNDYKGDLLREIHEIRERLSSATTASLIWCGKILKLLSEIRYSEPKGTT